MEKVLIYTLQIKFAMFKKKKKKCCEFKFHPRAEIKSVYSEKK